MPFADDIIEQMKEAAKEMLKNGERRRKVPLDNKGYLLLSRDKDGIILSQTIKVEEATFFFGFDKKNFK